MIGSDSRILTTHAGSLPRPESLTDLHVAKSRGEVAEFHRATPVILVPAAVGPAPLGLASTGDSRMNAPWTALGTPAITIPMPVGDALPLGLQLTASHGDEARLLRVAARLEQILT